MAVNYLTLRSTISYATDGTQAPINSLMAVSSVGVTTWTNRIAISTLTASTITASTVSFSTMTVSTLNTFVVGQGAGTGAGNTVFGLNAATANTTGSGNTSFGFSTMSTNTTGIANTAMGYMALASNISSFNTAMGYAALASNISTMNTAVGALAMQNNTSGTLNVGVGHGALTSATNTIANTAVGTNAITTTTTGSYNTAIGMQTLFYNTTGQYNTCLGYSAGLTGVGAFTGSYNTYLGHLAYPSGMGVVNEIVLGGSSTNSVANTGNGSNSVTIGNSATTKHIFTAGNVGIGTTNPTATLHVNGSLAKSSGTFDIEHPLYPNTQKRLVHSFIEGPRCDLIYRGKKTLVAGQAIIDINKECTFRPEDAMDHGTFEALCANPDIFLQNRTGFARVMGSITDGTLTITCEDSSSMDTISWMVVAERKDTFIKKWDRTDADGYLITQYES